MTDHIHNGEQTTENAKKYCMRICHVFIDSQKPFDTINQQGVDGVNKKIATTLQKISEESDICIESESKTNI